MIVNIYPKSQLNSSRNNLKLNDSKTRLLINPPKSEHFEIQFIKPVEKTITVESKLIEEHVVQKHVDASVKKEINTMSLFKINPNRHSTIKLTPNAQVKNDKVDLFIDSFSNNFKEMYQQLGQFKISDKGISFPEQDKVFFETVIKKDHFSNFITTSESQSEFTKQQVNFTWDCKVSEGSGIEDDLNKYNTDLATGYVYNFKYTYGLSIKTDGRAEEKPLREFLELARTLMKDEMVFIQFGFQPCEREWFKDAEKQVKDLPKRKHVSETSKLKIGYSGFDCCLRLVVLSPDKNRRLQLYRGYNMALKQLNGDQELIPKEIKYNKFDKWFKNEVLTRKIPVSILGKKRNIMTWKEMCNFIKLPKRSLQIDFNLQSIDRVEPDIPKVLQSKDGVLIGHTEFKGKKSPILLPISNLDDFCKSYVFTGSPRMGKDTSIINLIVESAKKNVGAFIPDVIDEKGNDRGMADSIRDSLPPEKIIDLNIGDYFNPIYFGLEDVAKLIGSNGMNVIADNFVKVLGLENTTNAQELCVMIAKACKCNIYKMYCFLKSKKFALQIYEQLLKEEDKLLAMEIKHEYLNNNKAGEDQGGKALKTRLKVILGNPHFKNMMAQDNNPNINFEKWIREHKVVLLRMKKIDIGDIGVQILMYLLSMKIFWIKKIIATNDCTFIVYNEPKQFLSDGLSDLLQDMMTESPKYRLSPIFAFHHPDMLGSNKLWNVMQSASINWLLFKNTNLGMYKSVEEQLNPITIEMAMKTKQYESIFLPFVGGQQLTPFFVDMLPPPSKRQVMFNNEQLTAKHSKLYGRPVQKIRERIFEIESSMYAEKEA